MSWPVVPLSQALKDAEVFVDGDWVESKDQDPNGDVRLIQLADIGDGFFVDKSARFLTSEKAQKLRCTFLEEGDVLVARMPDPLGRACIFPGSSQPCVTVVDVCIIRPNTEHIDPQYLVHCLNNRITRQAILKQATGTTRQRISRGNLKTIKIPHPPIEEQRRIAGILDRAEELRAKRRAAIALLDQLPQAIFIETFGSDTPTKPLSILADLKRGPFGGALKKEFFTEAGYKVYEQGNVIASNFHSGSYYIDERRFQRMKGFAVRENDLLVTCSGTVGRIAQVPVDAAPGVINQALLRIRADSKHVRPTFLHMALQSDHIQRVLTGFTRGTGLKNFPPMPEVKALEIPTPSLAAQDTYLTNIDAICRAKAAHQSALTELDVLFTSLHWTCFSGHISK